MFSICSVAEFAVRAARVHQLAPVERPELPPVEEHRVHARLPQQTQVLRAALLSREKVAPAKLREQSAHGRATWRLPVRVPRKAAQLRGPVFFFFSKNANNNTRPEEQIIAAATETAARQTSLNYRTGVLRDRCRRLIDKLGSSMKEQLICARVEPLARR